MKFLHGINYLDGVKKIIKNELSSVPFIQRPGLAILINGDDIISSKYINALISDCNDVGINIFPTRINSRTDPMFVYRMIDDFNVMDDITSIMIQTPFPNHMRDIERDIINMVSKKKLIDAPYWKMDLMDERTWPGTAYGVYQMLCSYCEDLSTKRVIVIGKTKNEIIPLSMILMDCGATVIACDCSIERKDIVSYCGAADIIINMGFNNDDTFWTDIIDSDQVIISSSEMFSMLTRVANLIAITYNTTGRRIIKL